MIPIHRWFFTLFWKPLQAGSPSLKYGKKWGKMPKNREKWLKMAKNRQKWPKTAQKGQKSEKRPKKWKNDVFWENAQKKSYMIPILFFREKSKSAKMAKNTVKYPLFWRFWSKKQPFLRGTTSIFPIWFRFIVDFFRLKKFTSKNDQKWSKMTKNGKKQQKWPKNVKKQQKMAKIMKKSSFPICFRYSPPVQKISLSNV